MRVLLTTHAFLPRSVAGVEVYTARLARALQDLGHTVRVLTAAHDLSAAPYSTRRGTVEGLDVVEIVNPHLEVTFEATYRVAALDRAVAAALADFRPECVHAQHLLNLSTGLFSAARELGAPVVLTLHDYWLSCPRDGLRMQADGTLCANVDHGTCATCLRDSPYLVAPLQRGATRAAQAAGLGGVLHALHRTVPRATGGAMRLMRRVWPAAPMDLAAHLDERAAHLRGTVREAHALIAPTAFARDRALEWGAPPEKLALMPLGAVVGPTQPRPAARRTRFGYVGTLAPHKGVHVLLEALAQLPRRDWSLDVFGNLALDAAYSTRLHALASGDSRIRFHGAIAPSQQARIWNAVDLLVLPSLWWENSPLTVLEALAAGVPVVASRTGGVPEVLPEGAGVLVPPGDVVALRSVLTQVLEGRLLAGALPALSLKTAREGAQELATLYARLARAGALGA
jgi:glycosyltransferase involved in cell wall biosynthesis